MPRQPLTHQARYTSSQCKGTHLFDGRLTQYTPIQVIKESQRLFPAAAIGPIRFAAENAELGGYFIPKGTRVQVRQKRRILPQAYTFCCAVR